MTAARSTSVNSTLWASLACHVGHVGDRQSEARSLPIGRVEPWGVTVIQNRLGVVAERANLAALPPNDNLAWLAHAGYLSWVGLVPSPYNLNTGQTVPPVTFRGFLFVAYAALRGATQ